MENQRVLEKIKRLQQFLKGFNVKGKFFLYGNVTHNLDEGVNLSYANKRRMGELLQVDTTIFPVYDIVDIVMYCSDEDTTDDHSVYMGFEIIYKSDGCLKGQSYQILDHRLYFDGARTIEEYNN